MKEVVEFLVKKLVDKPQSVKVEEKQEGNITKFKISVEQNDIGKVIGKKGQNISAIRVIMKAIGAKERENKVLVDLIEF